MRSTDFQRKDKVCEGLRKILKFSCGPCGQQIFRDKIMWERDLKNIEIQLLSTWSTDFQRQDKFGQGLRKILKFGCGPCGQRIFRDKIKWVRDLAKKICNRHPPVGALAYKREEVRAGRFASDGH